jgi:hypothetical protein
VETAVYGSYIYNYKGYSGVVVLPAVSTECDLTDVNISCNGRNSEGGVIKTSHFIIN